LGVKGISGGAEGDGDRGGEREGERYLPVIICYSAGAGSSFAATSSSLGWAFNPGRSLASPEYNDFFIYNQKAYCAYFSEM